MVSLFLIFDHYSWIKDTGNAQNTVILKAKKDKLTNRIKILVLSVTEGRIILKKFMLMKFQDRRKNYSDTEGLDNRPT